jgi:hypothetical protein
MANRRILLKAIETVQAGGLPPGFAQGAVASQRMGPDTVDGIAPSGQWPQWWREACATKRSSAPWNAALTAYVPSPADTSAA